MATRYFEMISWGIQNLIFSLGIISLYYVMDKSFHIIHIKQGNRYLTNIYPQDLFLISILILIIGSRCNNGSDYYNYLTMYLEVDQWYSSLEDVLKERFQNGYMLICYIVKHLIGGKYSIFFIIATLIYFPTIGIFRKHSPSPVLSFACWVLLGYLSMSTNIIKQSLAMTCVLVMFFALTNRKYIYGVIFALAGCVFHLSVICIFIIIILSVKINPSLKLYKILLIAGLGLYIFLEPILIQISTILPIQYVDKYIDAYLENRINEIKLQYGAMIVAIFYITILWSLIKRYNISKEKHNKINKHLLSISLMCIPFLLIGIKFYLFNRLAYSGLQFSTILIPSYFCVNKGDKTVFLTILIFSLLFTILCAENNYYQYSTIFNDTPSSVYEFAKRRV